jgi:hypothetical protein
MERQRPLIPGEIPAWRRKAVQDRRGTEEIEKMKDQVRRDGLNQPVGGLEALAVSGSPGYGEKTQLRQMFQRS